MKVEGIVAIECEQRQVMRALACGTPEVDVCEEFGLTKVQLKKLMAAPLFAAQLKQLEDQVFAEMVRSRAPYMQEGEASVEVLRELRDDKTTPPSVRSRCAMALLHMNYGKPGAKLDVMIEGAPPVVFISPDDDIKGVLEEARRAGDDEEVNFEEEEVSDGEGGGVEE